MHISDMSSYVVSDVAVVSALSQTSAVRLAVLMADYEEIKHQCVCIWKTQARKKHKKIEQITQRGAAAR